MPLEINDLKVGLTITLDNEVFMIIGVDHVKPGKGAAFARTKLRNLRIGTVIERTFRTNDIIEEAYIEDKSIQFSYKAGEVYHFIDQDTFEDLSLEGSRLKEVAKFLKENMVVTAFFYKGELLNIELPSTVEYKVLKTEPGFKGDTAKSSFKPAVIETGAVIQVPLFIEVGDVIKVDTRTGEYGGRA